MCYMYYTALMLLEGAGPWETIAREKGMPLAYTSSRQLYKVPKVALSYFCRVASLASKVALPLNLAN